MPHSHRYSADNMYALVNLAIFVALWGTAAYIVIAHLSWWLWARLALAVLLFFPLGYFAHWILPRLTAPVLKRLFRVR